MQLALLECVGRFVAVATLSFTPTAVEADEAWPPLLAPDDRAPLGQVVFPGFGQRPVRENALVPNGEGGYTIEETDLPDRVTSQEAEPTAEDIERGATVLRRAARFIEAQRSVRMRVRYHLDEEGSMGFVGGDTVHDVVVARPNLVSIDAEQGSMGRRTRIVANGEHVVRQEGRRIFAQPSPDSLAGIVRLEALRRLDGWGLEISRLLALMDGEALAEFLDEARVHHAGTAMFGEVEVDRVVIRDRDSELRWDRIGWEVYVARGERPVPVAVRLDQDDVLFYVANKERHSDSWLHLVDWRFNAAGLSEAFTPSLEDVSLVDGMGSIYVGEIEEINPMVGRDLPTFTATDVSGSTRRSEELHAERPRVLILSDERCHLVGAWWEGTAELATRYAGRADVSVLHVGGVPGEQALEELARWGAEPDLLLDCDNVEAFEDGAFTVDWGGNRVPARLGERLAYYVVGTDGRIHAVVEMGRGVFEEVAKQLDGLLAGEDMVLANRETLARQLRSRASRLEALRASFAAPPERLVARAAEDTGFASPAEAVAAFDEFWLAPNGSERMSSGAAWIERATASELGDEAYLLPLVRYVFEDYRERPARTREVYECFCRLEATPVSLEGTLGVVDRFVLGPLIGEIREGELGNVDSILPILADAEQVPYRAYAPVGAALRRSPAPDAPAALARLIRRAAADERVGDGRLVALIELCAAVEPEPARPGGGETGAAPETVAFVHFEGEDLDGQTHSTRGYPGEVVLVDFWATWCGPCLQQSPEIVALADEFGENGLRVLGVSLDSDGAEARIREVAGKFDLEWPHLFDGGGWQTEPALLNDVRAIPEIVLIDRSGRARFRGLRGDALRERVRELIAEPAPARRPARGRRGESDDVPTPRGARGSGASVEGRTRGPGC